MQSKLAALSSLMATDDSVARQFLDDPQSVLSQFGLSAKDLDAPSADSLSALRRAESVINTADLTGKTAEDSIKAIASAAKTGFLGEVDVHVDPLGFTLLERVAAIDRLDMTGTGTVKCTYSNWDGCGPDVDF